jgi:hypothetical protein
MFVVKLKEIEESMEKGVRLSHTSHNTTIIATKTHIGFYFFKKKGPYD